MKILKFVSKYIESNSYLIVNDQENAAIVIDPCDTKELFDYIDINGYLVELMILTHEHFDHISGVNCFREKYFSRLMCSEACNRAIQNTRLNMSAYFEALLTMSTYSAQKDLEAIKPYTCMSAENRFVGNMRFEWYGYSIELYEAPGHSKGSICILINNECLFSGDSLIMEYDVITRLPGGSMKDYTNITLAFFNKLNSDITVYPGHGDSFILGKKL